MPTFRTNMLRLYSGSKLETAVLPKRPETYWMTHVVYLIHVYYISCHTSEGGVKGRGVRKDVERRESDAIERYPAICLHTAKTKKFLPLWAFMICSRANLTLAFTSGQYQASLARRADWLSHWLEQFYKSPVQNNSEENGTCSTNLRTANCVKHCM